MAQIKFYRSGIAPANPQEGFIWFNTSNRTIQLYKSSAWEIYTGLIDATFSSGKLEITKYDDSKVTVDISDMASKSTLDTLSNSFNQLQISFNTLSGEFASEKDKISTLQNNMTAVQNETAKLADVSGSVGTAISNAVKVESDRASGVEQGLANRIGSLELDNTTNKSNIQTNTNDIAALKLAIGESGSVSEAITSSLETLDADVTSTDGTNVNVRVVEVDGKITEVHVTDASASSQELANEITRATGEEGKLSTAINTEKGRINTLYGVTADSQGDSGKSVRTIANEELASQLLSGSADADFKTLQELASWLEDHPESASAMNNAISANSTSINNLTSDVNALKEIDHDAYKAADTALEGVLKSYADTAESDAVNTANAYTDALANGAVSANTTAIAAAGEKITTIEGQIASINTTIEENELTVASALTDLDTRVNELSATSVKSVSGQDYVLAETTDGAVVVKADLGSVANGETGLALASDVKEYVDSTWEWASF